MFVGDQVIELLEKEELAGHQRGEEDASDDVYADEDIVLVILASLHMDLNKEEPLPKEYGVS